MDVMDIGPNPCVTVDKQHNIHFFLTQVTKSKQDVFKKDIKSVK